MYLNINNERHGCRAPRQEPGVYYKILMDDVYALPELPLAGTFKLMSEDGFELASISSSDYERQEISGSWLIFTNLPEPEDEPEEPDENASADEVLNALLGVEE